MGLALVAENKAFLFYFTKLLKSNSNPFDTNKLF
jgi:hypothetical protein